MSVTTAGATPPAARPWLQLAVIWALLITVPLWLPLLGGYTAIADGEKLEIDTPLHGVAWTSTGTHDRIAVTCGGREKELLAVDDQELKVKVTALDGALLVDLWDELVLPRRLRRPGSR